MKKIGLLILPLLLAISQIANAFSYKYNSHDVSSKRAEKISNLLKKDYDKLPLCVQKKIEERLHVVILGNHALPWPIDARSWPQGVMLLEISDDHILKDGTRFIRPLDNEFIHELGHYYNWALNTPTLDSYWKNAVKEDWELLNPAQQKYNYYMAHPEELFAEMFAEKFRGVNYYDYDHYDINLFVNSRIIFDNLVCED